MGLRKRSRGIFGAVSWKIRALLFLALIAIGLSLHDTRAGFHSSELRFTDASHGGLAIVPASCPSLPHWAGDCTSSATAAEGTNTSGLAYASAPGAVGAPPAPTYTITGVGGVIGAGGTCQVGSSNTIAAISASSASTQGLLGNYFSGSGFTPWYSVYVDPQVNFNPSWPLATRANVTGNAYSAIWSGYVKVDYTGTYTFYVTNSSGARLDVNDVRIIDDLSPGHAAVEDSGRIDLVAGKWYKIVLLYNNSAINSSGAITLSYSGGVVRTVYLTSGTSWTVPSDWSNAHSSIEVIGGGGGGAYGLYRASGGAGGYSASYADQYAISGSGVPPLSPGQVINYSVGSAGAGGTSTNVLGGDGGDTWFDSTSILLAKGGTAPTNAYGLGVQWNGGTGGQVYPYGGVGQVQYAGGSGGTYCCGTPTSGFGGGGAGGPGGNGKSAPADFSGGHAENIAVSGGAGGAAGTSAAPNGGAGGNGIDWGSTHGSGGGGGSGYGDGSTLGGNGGNAGSYGGAGGGGGYGGSSHIGLGGAGAQGLIVITYPIPGQSMAKQLIPADHLSLTGGEPVYYIVDWGDGSPIQAIPTPGAAVAGDVFSQTTFKQTTNLLSGWQGRTYDDSSWTRSFGQEGDCGVTFGCTNGFAGTNVFWIWSSNTLLTPDTTNNPYFRKGFIPASSSGTLTIRSAGNYTAYVNGTLVGSATGPAGPNSNAYPVTLLPGTVNVLAVNATHAGTGVDGWIGKLSTMFNSPVFVMPDTTATSTHTYATAGSKIVRVATVGRSSLQSAWQSFSMTCSAPATPQPNPPSSITIGGASSCTSGTSTTISLSASTETGLGGLFYSGTAFNTYKSRSLDATINFPDATNIGTVRTGASTGWSAKWFGYVKADVTGVYTFYVSSDDGARLYVNGNTVVNSWIDQAYTEHSGTISLTAGNWYPIELDYYQNISTSGIALSYSASGVTKQIIPATNLRASGVSYAVNWGDGTAVQTVPASGFTNPMIAYNVSHTYAAAGTSTISVTATNQTNQTSTATTKQMVCSTATCANGLNINTYPSCTCPAAQTQSGSTCGCANGLNATTYPTCACPAGQTQSGSSCITPVTVQPNAPTVTLGGGASCTQGSPVSVDMRASSDAGLAGDFYTGTAYNTFKGRALDAIINFTDATAIGTNRTGASTVWSAKWYGYVRADFNETYTFQTVSDDGVRLTVNGVQIINNWTDHAATTNSGTIALTAGNWYPVQLEFYQNTATSEITLSNGSPSLPMQIIPSGNLKASGVYYSINWGDGTVQTYPTSGFIFPSATTTVAHTYASAGNQTVSVTATNQSAQTGAATAKVLTCAASCTPAYYCSGSQLMHTDASCGNTLVQNCTYGCGNGACNPAPTPSIVSFNVTPYLVTQGNTATVQWSTTNTTSCTVSSPNGDSWSGTSGSATTRAITGQTSYTITCNGLDGSVITQTIQVNVVPTFCEVGVQNCP